jgi:hypothetical protein
MAEHGVRDRRFNRRKKGRSHGLPADHKIEQHKAFNPNRTKGRSFVDTKAEVTTPQPGRPVHTRPVAYAVERSTLERPV